MSVSPDNSPDVTQLITCAQQGNREAADQLFVLVFNELKRIAQNKIGGEPAGATLQATALVNEVWLKLIGNRANVSFDTRGHFFVAAADAMRKILIDAARARKAVKRGGEFERHDLSGIQLINLPADNELLDLQDALCAFEDQFPARAKIVKLRYFAGMTNAEAAETLSISTATAERYWAFARAWLKRVLLT